LRFNQKSKVAENLERVILKNYNILKNYPPDLYGRMMRSVGMNPLRANKIEQARIYFPKAIRKNLLRIRGYCALLLSFLNLRWIERILRLIRKVS